MKVQTVLLSKIPKKIPKRSMWVMILALLIELVFNNLLPFMLGVYFAMTQNVIFFGIFIFMLLFNVKIDFTKDKMEIKIIRGF